jgi:hypothetical protein
MPQVIRVLDGAAAADVAAKRKWVREHYEPEAQHKYDSLEGKLGLLSAIIANKWIEPDETVKLQSLGITFGDALLQAQGLRWVLVEDEYGLDPALVLDGTSVKVFPLTTISKRIEAGESVNVREMFRSACETIQHIVAKGA